MSKPQQPELARSGRGATDPGAIKSELSATETGVERQTRGVVPADNQPGHHPEHEQDKPDGAAFVQKVQRLAEESEAQDAEAEVVDVRETGTGDSELADRLAGIAGTPFKLAGDALQKVRDRL